jgi:hypothetical protein
MAMIAFASAVLITLPVLTALDFPSDPTAAAAAGTAAGVLPVAAEAIEAGTNGFMDWNCRFIKSNSSLSTVFFYVN